MFHAFPKHPNALVKDVARWPNVFAAIRMVVKVSIKPVPEPLILFVSLKLQTTLKEKAATMKVAAKRTTRWT